MKKLFGLVALLSLSFVLSARATEVKLMSWAINEAHNANKQDEFKKDIATNGIDMALFDYTKGAGTTYFIGSNFKENDISYFATYRLYGTKNNYKYLVCKGEDYRLVNDILDPLYVLDQSQAAVFEDKYNDVYAFVNLRPSSSYSTETVVDVGNYLDGILAAHPGARLFVSYNQRLSATSAEVLNTYLVDTYGLTCLGRGSVGGFYAPVATLPTAYSVADVRRSHATYTGTVCTVTYPTKHKVVFEDWDGTGLQTNVVLEGGAVTPPTPPGRPGFVFTGWDHEAEEFACVMEDFTATARYEQSANSHLVGFFDWDGTQLDEVGVDDGDKVPRPDDPHRDGYTFICWQDEGVPYDFDAPVTNDLSLVAAYELIPSYEIGTAEELLEKLSWNLPASVVYTLTNDLDFAGMSYTPVDFYGTLDGGGHSIVGHDGKRLVKDLYGTVRNLVFQEDGEEHTIAIEIGSIAAHAYGARIENCEVRNLNWVCRVTNGKFGGLVAFSGKDEEGECTIVSNCVVRGCRLRGDASYKGEKIGGFIGCAAHTRVYDSQFLSDSADGVSVGDGTVASGGGIVGYAEGNVEVNRCLSEGYVRVPCSEGNNTGAGGIVGGTSGSCAVYDCTNRATIVGCHQNGNGGIVGRAAKTSVTIGRCANYGSVSAEVFGTGTNPLGIGAGGIFGGNWYNTSATLVFDCANFGSVTTGTNAVPAGGIVATIDGNNGNTSSTISNCMNYASVSSPSAAGGVLGSMSKFSRPLYNVGNSGAVESRLDAGGIVGRLTFYLNNNNSGVYGLMQAGDVTTSTGFVGVVVGRLVGASNSGCAFPIRCGVLAGSATATDGGQAGLVVGGTSPHGTAGNIAYSVDELTAAVDTEMVHYYDKTNCPCYFDSLAPMSANDLTRKATVAKLNAYAEAKGHMPWVRGRNFPELERWGTPYNFGMVLLVR